MGFLPIAAQLLGLANAGGQGAQPGRAPVQPMQPNGTEAKPIAPDAPGQPGFAANGMRLIQGLNTLNHPEQAMGSALRNYITNGPGSSALSGLDKPTDPRADAWSRLQQAHPDNQVPPDTQALFNLLWE